MLGGGRDEREFVLIDCFFDVQFLKIFCFSVLVDFAIPPYSFCETKIFLYDIKSIVFSSSPSRRQLGGLFLSRVHGRPLSRLELLPRRPLRYR